MPSRRTSGLRVALVDPSGFSRPYDHELATALARRGHDVTLWTSRFAHGEAPAPRGYRVREHFYRLSGRLRVGARLRPLAKGAEHLVGLAALGWRLLAERPDIVHVQWVVVHPVERPFYRLLRRAGLATVLTAHDPRPHGNRPGRARSLAATARVFDRVIAHSGHGRSALIRECGVPESRVREVPHGVLGYLRELRGGVAPAPPEGPLAVLPGIIRPYKGIDVLLQAWPAVREHVPDAGLVIAGRLMMDTRLLPIGQPGITFVPRFLSDQEFAALLRRADAVVLPYRSVDNSGVAFAALAFGTPLVLSDVGGFRDLHELHGIGLMVPPEDPAALAAALVQVLGDEERRSALREASAAAASSTAGWPRIAGQTEAVYRELADGAVASDRSVRSPS